MILHADFECFPVSKLLPAVLASHAVRFYWRGKSERGRRLGRGIPLIKQISKPLRFIGMTFSISKTYLNHFCTQSLILPTVCFHVKVCTIKQVAYSEVYSLIFVESFHVLKYTTHNYSRIPFQQRQPASVRDVCSNVIQHCQRGKKIRSKYIQVKH